MNWVDLEDSVERGGRGPEGRVELKSLVSIRKDLAEKVTPRPNHEDLDFIQKRVRTH